MNQEPTDSSTQRNLICDKGGTAHGWGKDEYSVSLAGITEYMGEKQSLPHLIH